MIPRPTSTQASSGSAAASPQTPTGLPARRPACGRDARPAQQRRLPRVGEVGQVGRQPVGGQRVLRQVVGADRQEVDVLEQPVGLQCRRRDLDHHARHQARGRAPGAAKSAASATVATIGAITHGRRRRPARGLGDGVQLAVEQPGSRRAIRSPRTPSAGFGLVGQRGEGQRLVRPGVQRAEHDLAAREGGEHLGIAGRLLLDRRLLARDRGRPAPCGTGRRPRRGRRPRPARRRRPARWPAPATACPSRVLAGPGVAGQQLGGRRAGRRPGRRASLGSGSTVTVPCSPSSSTVTPAGTSSRPPTATTQGSPSCRAMIAVWLVVPPEPGGQPDRPGPGRGPAVSAGARSSASSTDGHVGARDARLPLPGQLGDDAVPDVADVGDPLGHQAAERGEQVDELLGRLAPSRPRRGAPASIRCSTAPRSARSRAMPAVVVSTSALTPVAAAARAGQPAGHRVGGGLRSAPSPPAGRSSETAGSPAGGQLHGAGGPDDRAERDPGDDGRAGQDDRTGGRRQDGGAGRWWST